MKIITCDRCGKKISEDLSDFGIETPKVTMETGLATIDTPPKLVYDLCIPCHGVLVCWLRGFISGKGAVE